MLRLLTVAFLAACTATVPPPARAAFETQATAAIVIDLTTDTELLAKNADTPLPPASMSKLMTLFMLFEAVRDNPNVTLDTRFGVSTKARQMGGSTMFLNERDRPTVEELIRGIIVQSGNDATVVVAEGLAGTEENFARLTNERAAELGMTQSNFVNASGWPHPDHRMSLRDLAILTEHIIEDFPDIYPMFAQQEWPFDGRAPQNRFNRNPVLRLGIGADGLKTGHTQEAGYGLVGSAKQGDRRIVFVITGLETTKARADESERIVAWAFRQFLVSPIAAEGDVLAEAPVWMGDARAIGLVAPEELVVLREATSNAPLGAEVVFESPIPAPIAAGDQVAELHVTREGLPDARLPLVADRDVTYGGFVPRMRSAGMTLVNRVIGEAQGLF